MMTLQECCRGTWLLTWIAWLHSPPTRLVTVVAHVAQNDGCQSQKQQCLLICSIKFGLKITRHLEAFTRDESV